MKPVSAAAVLLFCAMPAMAFARSPETPAPPLTCGGDEPFWSLKLGTDGKARLSDGNGEASTTPFTLQQSRNTTLIAGVTFGSKGEIRAVIGHEACSATNSDEDRPMTISVWYKDGLLSGCCQPDS
ncbi:MAG: hypothetical protein GY873_14915 [Bosea sp.]|uniref:hypothetical protein n=1 Tax=Bosea sp. (in: a-proteobacteria) TaxID=1871050 RepID=UPI00238C1B31|nr:hypothetical protein [Bosea sp. (in: a-proteobacteria)]MCP4735474.1 hypothetical protein [Bosea sp. (in: a-proteobacteria)]